MILPFTIYLISVVSIGILAARAPRHWWPRAQRIVCFALPAVIAVIITVRSRWSTMLPQQSLILPDEGQFLASAMKLASGSVIPWIDFDGGTTGPMVQVFLLPAVAVSHWPFLAARLEMAVITALWALMVAIMLSRVTTPTRAQLAASPIVILGIAPWYFDWYSFSAEFVSITLLLTFIVLEVGRPEHQRLRGFRSTLAFFCLGLAPFAKIQIGPLALVLGVVVLIAGRRWLVNPYHFRRSLLPIAAAFLPTAAAIIAFIFSSSIRHQILFGFGFMQRYSASEAGNKMAILETLARHSAMSGMLLSGAAASIVAIIIVVFWFYRGQFCRNTHNELALISITAFPMGLFCAVYPGRDYGHYWWYLGIGATLSLACGSVLLSLLHPRFRWVVIAPVCVAVLLTATGPISVDWSYLNPQKTAIAQGQLLPQSIFEAPQTEDLRREVAAHCRGEIAVWAWDPDLYLVTETKHATTWATLIVGEEVGIESWIDQVKNDGTRCIVESFVARYYPTPPLASRVNGASLLRRYHRVWSSSDYALWIRSDGYQRVLTKG